jgi:hypothetical protein
MYLMKLKILSSFFKSAFVAVFLAGVFLFGGVGEVEATENCSDIGVTATGGINETFSTGERDSHTISIKRFSTLDPEQYKIKLWGVNWPFRARYIGSSDWQTASGQTPMNFTFTIKNALIFNYPTEQIYVYVDIKNSSGTNDCYLGYYSVLKEGVFQLEAFRLERDGQPTTCADQSGSSLTIILEGVTKDGVVYQGDLYLDTDHGGLRRDTQTIATNSDGNARIHFDNYQPPSGIGTYTLGVRSGRAGWGAYFASTNFVVGAGNSCTEGGLDPGTTPDSDDSFSFCRQIPESSEYEEQRNACLECVGGGLDDEDYEGVWTAIGCINRDPGAIMQRLIRVGLGIGGGIALITFLAAGFIFSTSQGDPKEYGKAKEMMTSAIVGLIFIIFSITILQFIGFSVLRIPGFGG